MIVSLSKDLTFLWNEGVKYQFNQNGIKVVAKKLFSGVVLFELDNLVHQRSGELKKFLPELKKNTRYRLGLEGFSNGLEISLGIEFYDDANHKVLEVYSPNKLADFLVPDYSYYEIKFIAHIEDEGMNNDLLKSVEVRNVFLEEIVSKPKLRSIILVVKNEILVKNLQSLIDCGVLDERLCVMEQGAWLNRLDDFDKSNQIYLTEAAFDTLKGNEFKNLNYKVLKNNGKSDLMNQLKDRVVIESLNEKKEINLFLKKNKMLLEE